LFKPDVEKIHSGLFNAFAAMWLQPCRLWVTT
jgi:hypothetical protein